MIERVENGLEREVSTMAMSRILQLNRQYELNDYHGQKGNGENSEVLFGVVPVMVSAPHAVKQWREGRVKRHDGATGGIVKYLVERFGVYGVVRAWEDGDDPNYGNDERSRAYRKRIAELVREVGVEWVFDIHACRDVYGFDMDVGINGGRY